MNNFYNDKQFKEHASSSITSWEKTLLHKHDLNDSYSKKVFSIIIKYNLRKEK